MYLFIYLSIHLLYIYIYIYIYIRIYIYIYIYILYMLYTIIFSFYEYPWFKTDSHMKNSPTITGLAQNRESALSCSQAAYLYHAVLDVRALCFELSFEQSHRFQAPPRRRCWSSSRCLASCENSFITLLRSVRPSYAHRQSDRIPTVVVASTRPFSMQSAPHTYPASVPSSHL